MSAIREGEKRERTPMTPKRAGLLVVQGIVILVVAYYVAMTLIELFRSDALYKLTFHPVYLAASVVLLGGYYVLYAHSMAIILRMLGDRVSLRDAFELNYVSALGKYVPGGVWHVVGRVALATSMGVRKRSILVTTVLENALGVVSGILVAAVFLGPSAARALDVPVWSPIVMAGAMLVAMHPAIFGRIMALGIKLMRVDVVAPSLTFPQILGQVAYRAFGWLVAGAAFMLLRNAIVVDPVWRSLGLYAGAYSAASVGGLLMIFAPGGIGVREAILIALLTPAYGTAGPVVAGAVGLGSRVWSTLVEMAVSALAVASSTRRQGRRATPHPEDS